MKLPPVVYVAGPFRGTALSSGPVIARDSWVMEGNIRRAEALSLDLWALGASVICPHCNTRFFQNHLPDNIWLKGDLAQLKLCAAVVMTVDWRASAGARAEWRYAIKRGVPVFYADNLSDFEDWLKGDKRGLKRARKATRALLKYYGEKRVKL